MADPESAGYRAAAAEIIRGIRLVSGLEAQPATQGWVAVECGDVSKAYWLSQQIRAENVDSYCEGTRFFVPVGEDFTLKSEIKNVITVVAKTTHYWSDHMEASLKQVVAWERRFQKVGALVRGFVSGK
ncbi:MAG: hypothetical protein U0175_06740 [Caldilineaceae bacterium]